MPVVTTPWNVRTTAGATSSIASGSARGDMHVHAGRWMGDDHLFVELSKEVAAPSGAFAVNVRMERPMHLTRAAAGAFGFLGYASASVTLSIVAREGEDDAREVTQSVVLAVSVLVNVGTATLDGSDFIFPAQAQPLNFVRPSNGPGSVTVGLRADCNAGGFGFLLSAAEAEFQSVLSELTVEWLWRA